ncbi:MAG TPA: hypothetical protein DD789_04065 [Firmicutes bacterium]|nr:hypothetical protein [Bacillota bacterium]
MVSFVGFDPGNNGLKVAYFKAPNRIGYMFVPNISAPAIPLDIPPAGDDEDVLAVEVMSADKEFQALTFLGNLALQQAQDKADQDRRRDRSGSVTVNQLVPAVLGLLYEEGRPFVMTVGATLQDIQEQKDKLIRKIEKKHKIKFLYGSLAGRTVEPVVIQCNTYPQAAAGLYSLLRNDDGSIRRYDWVDKTVLAIDIGHGQINFAIMDKMVFLKGACFSRDFGNYRVVNVVKDFLNSAPYYVTASIPQLQRATEAGYYTIGQEKIGLRDVIITATQETVELAYREVKDELPASLYNQITDIVVLGGVADRVAPMIQSRFSLPVEKAKTSLFENARGNALHARQKWEAEAKKVI